MRKSVLKTLTVVFSTTAPVLAIPSFITCCTKKVPTDVVIVTFNAGKGSFGTEHILNVEVKKGTKLGDVHITLPSHPEPGHTFRDWVYNGIELQGDFVLDNNITIFAEYNHPNVDHYVFDNNKIYGWCKDCEEKFKLSDAQMAVVANKMFIKTPTSDNYELTDKSLKEVIHDAFDRSVEIYFTSGNYDVAETWSNDVHNVNVTIHGVVSYSNGEQLSSFRCVDSESEGHQNQFVYNWHGMILNVDHVKLLGLMQNVPGGQGNWQDYGIQPTAFTATNCDVIGCHTTHALDKAKFENCTFDSTGFKNRDGSRIAEYCIYTWNGNTDLINCKFITEGKAVKIYTDYTPESLRRNKYFKIDSCTFTIKEKMEDKAAVEIDSQNVTGDFRYYITLRNSTYSDFGGADKLWNDKGTKSIFTPDPPSSY